MTKLINISAVSRILNNIDDKTNKPLNYILRYWEKEFKIIRPKKINNIRYYSEKQIEILKMIKFLLKNKGMTISGVKNLLNQKINDLDYTNTISLKADYYKNNLSTKSKKILEKIKKIREYGKKNTS
tara:strand:+ start:1348 stop:1728 length:381 start_codon:yes stop_codon:yes gene_type:complete